MKAKKNKSSALAAKSIAAPKIKNASIKKKLSPNRIKYALFDLKSGLDDPTVRGIKGVMPGTVDPKSDLFKVLLIKPEMLGLYLIPHRIVYRVPFRQDNPSYPSEPVDCAELSASFGPRLPDHYVPLIEEHHIDRLEQVCRADEQFMISEYKKNPKLEFDVFLFIRLQRLLGAVQSYRFASGVFSTKKLVVKAKRKIIRLAVSLKYIDLEEFVEVEEEPYIPPSDRSFPKRHIKYCLEPKEPKNTFAIFQPTKGNLIKIVPLADGAIMQENKVGFEYSTSLTAGTPNSPAANALERLAALTDESLA
ncbi:hypothetical protein DSO57_1000516 [Entomophthora muscae]|uniref:Uncharacterized protein n=1 Tax=Entomophthora muscae TaxID=34485 RepID=A0ACC2RP51_9FUNG|nr:hypothetical protein DSO57_1000516 [Entomophthora muscae]